MRKTKIVCTLGFVSDTEEIIEQLIKAGMNVARFNFSHSSQQDHKAKFDIVAKLREKLQIPVATLLDTKGPEIRLGEFEGGRIELAEGDSFTLTTEQVMGTQERASVSFAGLPQDVAAGSTILIDDGLIELNVIRVDGTEIVCSVINGGPVSNRKGVNVPGVHLNMPYISEQDKSDIAFGIRTGFDFIAASFVRSAEDILAVRSILHDCGSDDTRIIAKIENAEGVRNIDSILRVSDGIMVARGDLGVEIPFAEVPALQKLLIQKAYIAGKIVITATQMLDSMMKNPRPTRAEATDVANAIYDGTSAIMLSGETAAGLYPVKAVETMAIIADQTEKDINYRARFQTRTAPIETGDVTDAISHATCTTAYDLNAAAIVTVTVSGQTARMISRFRPGIPIIGGTYSPKTYNQLALSWGVAPLMVQKETDVDELFSRAVETACQKDLLRSGDVVVVTTGVPLGVSGTTNLIKVHVAGDVLASGKSVNRLAACGSLRVAHSEKEALNNFRSGEILVIQKTTNALLSLLKMASGIITEEDGMNSHAAVVGLTLDIPVIVGAYNATNVLKSGTIVTLDAERGTVSTATTQSAAK